MSEDYVPSTPELRKLKDIKEKLFALSMELEDLGSDLGYPYQADVLEVAAIIQEGCDTLEEHLNTDRDH